MTPIALRRLLPAVAAMAFTASSIVVFYEDAARDAESQARNAEFQWKKAKGLVPPNTVTFDLEHMIGRLPEFGHAELISAGFSTPGWPGTLLTLPFALLADKFVGERAAAIILRSTALFFTAITWYWMGLQLDRLLQTVGKPPALVRRYVAVLVALSPVWLSYLLLARVFDRHGSWVGNNVILWWIWMAWAVAGTLIAIRRLSKRASPA